MSEAVLKKLPNVILKKVNGIPNPYEFNGINEKEDQPSWTGSGYTKLYIWTMVQYEIIFYIDADCLV